MTFRKPIFVIERERNAQINVEFTVNRESIQSMGDVIAVIGVF